MDMSAFLLANVLNGLLGLVLLALGYKVFDLITPRWQFHEIFGNGHISNGGIVIGCFLLGLAIVIASTAG
jgi:putative membrane protein